MSQQEYTFEKTITKQAKLGYLLYLPPEYETQAAWPLLMFLHGRDERGGNLNLVKKYGPPMRIEAGDHFPFIVLSPQCPVSSYWPEEVDALAALIDDVTANFNVNTQRIYLTGLHMGAYGTWGLASRYPERFAAIAPVCGGGGWWMVDRLLNTPTWAFQGDSDDVVPIIESKVMVNRIRNAGGNAQFTVYSGSDADAWTRAYQEADLYDWFLEHQRS